MKAKRKLTPTQRLTAIVQIINDVDWRAQCCDGPVTATRHEMTDSEMRRIYALAKAPKRK